MLLVRVTLIRCLPVTMGTVVQLKTSDTFAKNSGSTTYRTKTMFLRN